LVPVINTIVSLFGFAGAYPPIGAALVLSIFFASDPRGPFILLLALSLPFWYVLSK